MISQFYSRTIAAVLVDDDITEQLSLNRCTKQGCHHSPILLALELLENVIRQHIVIRHMELRYKIKINLFADETLIRIENPLNIMDWVKIHLKEFGGDNWTTDKLA